jgi:hypothetical protein
MSDAFDPTDWLAQTPLGELQDAISRRLVTAFEAGRQEGHAAGSQMASARLRAAFEAGEAAAAARLAAEYERKQAEWEAERAEATLHEAEERGRAIERMLRERERAVEQRLEARLDEARRQGYREGSQGVRRPLGIEGSRSWALGVLHLSDEATLDEIRQRFRKLSLLMHPDRQPGLDDAFIKNLQRARDILGC